MSDIKEYTYFVSYQVFDDDSEPKGLPRSCMIRRIEPIMVDDDLNDLSKSLEDNYGNDVRILSLNLQNVLEIK